MTQKHFSAKVILSIIAALLIICTLSTVTLAANQVANYGCAYGQAVPTNDKLSAKVSQYNFYGDEGTLYFMQISKGKADAHYAVEIFSDKSLSPNTKIRSFTKEFSKTAGNVPLKITWDFKTTVSGTYYGRCYTYVETTKDGQITKTVDTSSFSTFQININRVGTKTVKLKSLVNTEYGPKITWEALPTGTKYNVYRKSTVKGEESWKLIKHLSYATTSFVDETAKSGVDYTYTVKGADIKYQSKYDTKGLTLKYLSMPKVTVTGVGVNGTAFLKWNEVPGAQGYYVYRKGGNLNNSGWKLITTIKNGKTVSYTDTAATSTDWHYTYTVKAYNGKTVSAYNQKGVDYDHIKAPTIKRVYSYDGGMRIEWANANENVKGYYVYRLKGTSWSYVGQTTQKYLIDSKAESLKSYTYTVKAFSKNNNGGYNNKGVTAKYIAAPTFTYKDDETIKTYRVAFDGKYAATVKWSAVDGAAGYIVYKKVNGATKWEDVADIKDGKTTVFKDESKKVGGYTYQYTVRAYDSKGIFSGFSATGTMGVCLAMPVVNVAQTETEDSSLAIEVSWGKIAGATGYNVYRKSNVSGEGSWKRIALVATTNYIDKSILPGKTYTYAVRALNDKGDQSYFRTLKGVTPVRIPTITNVVPVNLGTSQYTKITWNTLTGATGYNVYRMPKGGTDWELIATETTGQYTDTSDGAGTTPYYYAVTALLRTAESAKSIPVANFVEFSVKAIVVEDGIKLDIDCDICDSIIITRATGDEEPTKIYPEEGNGYSFIDKEAEKGVTYTYIVKVGKSDKIESSASVEIRRPHDPLEPTFISEYKNITANQNYTVMLTWVKVNYAEKYVVLRSINGQDWEDVNVVDKWNPDSTTITYLDHPESGTYWYKVKAIAPEADRPESESAPVSVEVLLPLGELIITENTYAPGTNNKEISVSWKEVANAEKYEIYRTNSPEIESSWKLINIPYTFAEKTENPGTAAETKSIIYTAIDNTITANGTYFYKVVASSEKRGTSTGITTDGTIITAIPLEAATIKQIEDATSNDYAIKLTWSVVDGAEHYIVLRSTDGTSWSTITICTYTDGDSISYTDTNVEPEVKYIYKIKADAPISKIPSSESAVKDITLNKRLLPFDKAEAILGTDNKAVTIGWSGVEGAEKYEVFRSSTPDDASSWAKIGVVKVTIPQTSEINHKYTDLTIEADGTYTYKVVAYSEELGEISAITDAVEVTGFAEDVTPEEPVTPPVDPENPPVDPENPGENEGGTDTPADPVDPENPPVNPENPGENEGGEEDDGFGEL